MLYKTETMIIFIQLFVHLFVHLCKKIYAYFDGNYTIKVGVHTIGCGGPQLVPLKFRIPRPLRKTAYI